MLSSEQIVNDEEYMHVTSALQISTAVFAKSNKSV